MRMTKLSLNTTSPAFPQERCFYTETDIRMIVKCAVQEAIAIMMVDEEPEKASDEEQKKPERLTVSVQEAADIVGVSKPMMFELLHNGIISHKRIGKKILISYKTLVDWVNANKGPRKEWLTLPLHLLTVNSI